MSADLKKQIGILVGSQLILNVGVSQVVPVLPLFARQMGLGASGVGLLIALPSISSMICSIPLGRMADKLGRVPLMRAGTLITSAGAVGTGLLMPYGLAVVSIPRLLIGLGSASSMAGSGAYMADLTDKAPAHRAKIMGFQGMVLGSAWVAGPVIGGYLAEAYGAQNSFFIAGIGFALCSFGYSFLPETLRSLPSHRVAKAKEPQPVTLRQHAIAWWKDARPLLQSPNQQALIAVAISNAVGQAVFMSVVTLHADNVWAAGASGLGATFGTLATIGLLSMPVGSWLADKVPHRKRELVVCSALISSTSFSMLAFATNFETFMASLVTAHLFSSLGRPAFQAHTAEVTAAHLRGQAMSLGTTVASGVFIGAPIALGVLADMTSCPTAILCATAVNVACNLFFAFRTQPVSYEAEMQGQGGQATM